MRNVFRTFLISLLVLALLVIVRRLLDPVLGTSVPFITVFAAVAFSVWIGGLRNAVPIAVAGYIAANILFLPRAAKIESLTLESGIVLLAFALTCSFIIVLGERVLRARAEAQEQREILQITLASIGDAVITTDTLAKVRYMNAVAQSMTGWPLEEAVGQPLEKVFEIVNETTRSVVESPAVRALREGVIVGLANHTVLIRRDGSETAIDDSAAPIRDADGNVSGCVLIFRDVSAQRLMERERAEQLIAARTLAAIVETSDDAIVSKTLDGVIRSWNAGAERVFGYRADEVIGRHISLIIPPERLHEEDRIISELRAGRRVDHFETVRQRGDGKLIEVSVTVSPIKDANGAVIGASKIARDITAQRAADEERKKFATLVESSTDFIGLCDAHGRPFFVNKAGLEMVGLDNLDAALRTPVTDFFFPEDRAFIADEFLPSVAANGHGSAEIRFRHFKTGAALWMIYKVVVLRDASGVTTGFATVSQEITERKRMEMELRQLASTLSEADRRKNEFLATLAHELRNPLAPIGNAAATLRLAPNDVALVRGATSMIERQVTQLSRLVDDLLEMSRITSGKIELRRETLDLRPIVAHAVEVNQAIYGHFNHHLNVSMPSIPVKANADSARIAQIAGNLLNNASKFTERGGRIDVTLECKGEFAELRVRDNGIGIAPERLPDIFEMFVQVDTSLHRSRDGLGIGLTLVKKLVEMHGGEISAYSEGENRGSEFLVRLPLLKGLDAPPTVRKSEGPLVPLRILIVDDNLDGAESLGILLRLEGHTIFLAHDGPRALEIMDRDRPDVVFLDIGLPTMDGYEVCRRIRARPDGNRIAIFALTGWGQEEDRRHSQQAGFDAHLTKPIDHDTLNEKIRHALNQRKI